MLKSSYPGNRGQAAALDLAIFVSICILALSYLFIQSTRSSGSREFIQENENVNEVAMRALRALVQSSGSEIEIMTIQPIAMGPIKADFSEDVRKIMRYADAAMRILDDIEREARNGKSSNANSNDPYFLYLKARTDDLSAYLLDMNGLVNGLLSEWLGNANSEKESPCDALDGLSDILPGYEDVTAECEDSLDDSFLGTLAERISNANDDVSDFATSFDLNDIESLDGIGLAETAHGLRCALADMKEAANSLLTYIETGLNLQVSFLELFPVTARSDAMTLEQMLIHASIAGTNLAVTDEARSLTGASGLLLMRNTDLGEMLPEFDLIGGDITEAEGVENSTEDIFMSPKAPLEKTTNVTAEGPYHDLTFGAQTYITQSGRLGVRLKVWGDGMPMKQKSNYFEGLDYIFGMQAYSESTHHRTYDGSFVKGRVEEDLITLTVRNWTESRNLTPEISSNSLFQERRLLRPMTTTVKLVYENLSWPNQFYEFDITHSLLLQRSNYTINTSQPDFDYNQSDALKSIILGALLSGRADMRALVAEALAERLDGLLAGYEYKFEVRDCCKPILEINADSEPVGREGAAKYYFMADGSRGEMKLIVWR